MPVNPFPSIPSEPHLNSLAHNDKSDDLGSYELNLLTVVSLVASTVAIVVVFINKGDIDQRVEDIENKFLHDRVYEEWISGNSSFIESNGIPSGKLERISILHYQFFEKGYILFNASSGWSVVLNHANKTFFFTDNPEHVISLHDPTKIKTYLLRRLHSGERQGKYLKLFQNGEITGGIGTLYVKHDLAPKLGSPNSKEMSIRNAAYMRGQKYDLLIGALNRPTDKKSSSIRAVYALFHNNKTYQRFPVDVGR